MGGLRGLKKERKGEKMEFKNASMDDFESAFDYIEKLWTYNTYDKDVIREVYQEVINDENSFAFFHRIHSP